MDAKTYVFDPTARDTLSKVRGVGRYLQILKENFPEWTFTNNLKSYGPKILKSIFINPFFNFLKRPLVYRKIAKKQVAVIHDIIPLKYPQHFPAGLRGNINIFLNQFVLKQYDVIVTDSQASKNDIVKLLHVDEKKVTVIYPTLPKTFLNDRHPERAERVEGSALNKIPANFCLYVGDATWNKNLVNLARAIKEINITCVFVGKVFEQVGGSELKKFSLPPPLLSNPWQKELNEFFYETAGDKRFIFTGYLPDQKLIKLYQHAKTNLLISRDEGFGFSYLEAASQGCPSVLSDIPVLREISDEKGALFVNHKNVNEIANAIGEIYFHQEKRQTLGSEAKHREEFFSSNSFKKNFLEIL